MFLYQSDIWPEHKRLPSKGEQNQKANTSTAELGMFRASRTLRPSSCAFIQPRPSKVKCTALSLAKYTNKSWAGETQEWHWSCKVNNDLMGTSSLLVISDPERNQRNIKEQRTDLWWPRKPHFLAGNESPLMAQGGSRHHLSPSKLIQKQTQVLNSKHKTILYKRLLLLVFCIFCAN